MIANELVLLSLLVNLTLINGKQLNFCLQNLSLLVGLLLSTDGRVTERNEAIALN